MEYIHKINSILKPQRKKLYSALDLYAGCGGLSLGFEACGFNTFGFEMNEDACETYNQNLSGHCFNEILTLETKLPKADVIIGGPPCQPFSVGGNQLGLNDFRNGFPVCISAVKKLKPKVFVFENVKGLLYKNKWYLEYLKEEFESLKYKVHIKLLNAKNFDVPQSRERIFIIGVRKGEYSFPKERNYTITAGEALGELVLQAPKESKYLNRSMQQYIARYERASNCVTRRELHLHKPARTLTCRNLAGSTGDMHRIKLPNGRKRKLLVREAARLQSFPDWFEFNGNETSIFNQIGNAVPPMMAYHVARSIKSALINFR